VVEQVILQKIRSGLQKQAARAVRAAAVISETIRKEQLRLGVKEEK
jgi:hypothetical protein